MFATAALASLLPDIDTPSSEAGRLIRPIASFLEVMVGHRTITHSITGTIIFALLFCPLTYLPIEIPLYSAAIEGYLSHLVMDMSNKEGIEFFFPLHHRWVFPGSEKYRLSVGSPGEKPLQFVMIGLALLLFFFHTIGPRSVLHRILATPSAASTEYYQQLLRNHRVEAKISGIWTKSQAVLKEQSFDIIASDAIAIYVRRREAPEKIYCVSDGPMSSISHAKIKAKKIGRAKQKVLAISFSNETWNETLFLRYPCALVSGRITTSAYPKDDGLADIFSTFDIDEYPTIRQLGGYWELVHTPIELLNEVLLTQTITGTLHLRYWED